MCSTDIELLLDLLIMQSTQTMTDEERLELERLLKLYPEYNNFEFDEVASLANIGFYMNDHRNQESIPPEVKKRIIESQYKSNLLTFIQDKINDFMRSLFYKPTYAWGLTVLLTIGLSFSMIEFKNYENNFRYLPLKRAFLQTTSTDIIEYPWYSKTSELALTKGDIVWSNERQKGFIKISGMPVNDPSINQYQVWIIDPVKYRQPVDGGVFNVKVIGDEIIIPINPKLPISNAKGFAITLEQPGGVVVSTQDLILTAPELRPENTFIL